MATTTKSRSRKAPVTAVVTVTKFTDSTRPFTVMRDPTSLAEFVPVTPKDYHALGHNTPLRDSVARFVAHLDGLRSKDRVVIGLLADESGSMHGNEGAVIQGINDFVAGMAEVKTVDPKTAGTVLAVVTTDGLNNASREISPEALQDLIAAREADGYTFIFLGASLDAWGTGQSLGLSGGARGQTVSYRNTPTGTAAAMANVTTDASSYLVNSGEYVLTRSAMGSMRSVTEDGTELTSNINAPGASPWTPPVTPQTTAGTPPAAQTFNSPYASVEDALRQARGETKGDE